MSQNLLDILIGGQKDLNRTKNLNTVNLYSPNFTGGYRAELNSTYTSVCDAHARHISKTKFKANLEGEQAQSRRYLTRLLSLRPNKIMNAPTFWESAARSYFMINNAFIFLEWDYTNYKQPLKALWLLDPDENSMTTAVLNGQVYIKFTLDGVARAASLDDVVVISRNVKPSNLFGGKSKAIDQVLKVLQTNYEGIDQAIKTSAYIRFIVSTPTLLNEKAKKDRADYFAETYLGPRSSSGVVYLDGAQNVLQVNSQAKYANAEEMLSFKNEIYEYLGSNSKITTASFTEIEWQAYYESSLEPFLVKACAELTSKIFTSEEIAKDNEIAFDANGLQTSSLKTRVQVASIIQKMPVFIPNTISDVLGIPRTEHGDEEYSNLNYVKTADATEYQTGKAAKDKSDDKEPDPEETDPEDKEGEE